MARPTDSDDAAPRKPNLREAILCAAEDLFSTNGFNAVSVRDIAQAAGANPGSVTYHFKTKDGLLLEIYRRHCGPMNLRRSELLAAAQRVRDLNDRLEAIVRAYVLPAFSSGNDLAGGGARFTRLRAVMSAEGNVVAGKIIAQTFDDTSHAFIDAICRKPAADSAHRDRLAQPFFARRALLHIGDARACIAPVARRGRWRRCRQCHRATGQGNGRLAAGARA